MRRNSPNGLFGSLEVIYFHLYLIHLADPIEEKGTSQRERFLFPKDLPAPSQASTSGLPASQGPISEDSPPTPAALPQDVSTPAPPSQKSTSLPAASKPTPRIVAPQKPQMSSSQFSVSTGSTSQPPTSSLPANTSSQVTVASGPRLAGPLPPVGTPNTNDDVALFVTALGVHQLLSQAANTLETPAVVEPSQFTGDQSQLLVPPSQVAVNPYQFTVDESLLYIAPPQDVVGPSQPDSPSQSTPESSQVIPMDTQPDSTVIPTPQKPYTEDANTSKVSYRARNPANVISGKRSHRDSIEGAPGIDFGLHVNPEVQDSSNDNEPEMTVDLSDYVNLDADDETHVSSSQKTIDECQEPLLAAPTRTHPRLDVDEDLPGWMIKRGQWKYIVSTAGGPNWETLLKLYMQQERRLEFTDKVGDLPRISLIARAKQPVGIDFDTRRPSIQDQGIFPICAQPFAG